jgi:hypothetical protein
VCNDRACGGDRGSRRGIPALPVCSLDLRGPKPLAVSYPIELTRIGDHIRRRRLDLGLSPREVAVKLGVDPSTVENWERPGCSQQLVSE